MLALRPYLYPFAMDKLTRRIEDGVSLCTFADDIVLVDEIKELLLNYKGERGIMKVF